MAVGLLHLCHRFAYNLAKLTTLSAVGRRVVRLVHGDDHRVSRKHKLALLARASVKLLSICLVIFFVSLANLAGQLNSSVVVGARTLNQLRIKPFGEDPVIAASVKRSAETLHLLSKLLSIKSAEVASQTANGSHEPHVHRDRLKVAVQVGVKTKADLGAKD